MNITTISHKYFDKFIKINKKISVLSFFFSFAIHILKYLKNSSNTLYQWICGLSPSISQISNDGSPSVVLIVLIPSLLRTGGPMLLD